ncbi:MAG: GNAT family N-acetyltransferase [Bacillota bacterium]
MEIKPIDNNSPHLIAVKALWRSNSDTLGYFPDGAFNDHAKRRQIIIALDKQKNCIGYLLYRVSRGRIIIVHLCVEISWRNKGIAKALVDYLRQTTKQFYGIGLWCRRDFPATRIWPLLGFIALSDKIGRSYNGKLLTFWWIDHGHATLFNIVDEQINQEKLRAVIDANVFYDLQSEPCLENEESKSLLEDWLQENLVLYLAPEMYNEINRNKEQTVINQQRYIASTFPTINRNPEVEERIIKNLRPIFPRKKKLSDESDLRQVAQTIVAGVQFFVTRDEALLQKGDYIYELFGLSLVRPCDLIIHLDELIREVEYQPSRLAGSHIKIKLIQPGQDLMIADLFQQSWLKETKSDFRRKLHRLLANPVVYETRIVYDADNAPLAIISYDRSKDKVLEISILRVLKGLLSGTLARHLIVNSVKLSSCEKRVQTKVTDNYLSEDVVSALAENNFSRFADTWMKFNFMSIGTPEELLKTIDTLSFEFSSENRYLQGLKITLEEAIVKDDITILFNIEKVLWPVKIRDVNIPSFIIPIKPKWALDLFDEEMAVQNLFGSKPELSLNCENVYYRARYPEVLSAPARILWYVSQDNRYYGSKCIRACSHLDEITIGKPKDLFRRYRRLGVYEWVNVVEVAKNNIDKEIMAVRFSNTELFHKPIPWKTLQRILLEEEGRNSQLQAPLRISGRTFLRLYSEGIQI